MNSTEATYASFHHQFPMNRTNEATGGKLQQQQQYLMNLSQSLMASTNNSTAATTTSTTAAAAVARTTKTSSMMMSEIDHFKTKNSDIHHYDDVGGCGGNSGGITGGIGENSDEICDNDNRIHEIMGSEQQLCQLYNNQQHSDYIISDYMDKISTRICLLETELKFAWRALDLLSEEYGKMWIRLQKFEKITVEQQSVVSNLMGLYVADGCANGNIGIDNIHFDEIVDDIDDDDIDGTATKATSITTDKKNFDRYRRLQEKQQLQQQAIIASNVLAESASATGQASNVASRESSTAIAEPSAVNFNIFLQKLKDEALITDHIDLNVNDNNLRYCKSPTKLTKTAIAVETGLETSTSAAITQSLDRDLHILEHPMQYYRNSLDCDEQLSSLPSKLYHHQHHQQQQQQQHQHKQQQLRSKHYSDSDVTLFGSGGNDNHHRISNRYLNNFPYENDINSTQTLTKAHSYAQMSHRQQQQQQKQQQHLNYFQNDRNLYIENDENHQNNDMNHFLYQTASKIIGDDYQMKVPIDDSGGNLIIHNFNVNIDNAIDEDDDDDDDNIDNINGDNNINIDEKILTNKHQSNLLYQNEKNPKEMSEEFYMHLNQAFRDDYLLSEMSCIDQILLQRSSNNLDYGSGLGSRPISSLDMIYEDSEEQEQAIVTATTIIETTTTVTTTTATATAAITDSTIKSTTSSTIITITKTTPDSISNTNDVDDNRSINNTNTIRSSSGLKRSSKESKKGKKKKTS